MKFVLNNDVLRLILVGINVYCEENALYEVRMSEDALDIKINQ